jgi:prophage antirepressor-like protein
MTNLSPIAFDKENNPWFSLYDVCTAIGLKKSSHNKTLSKANLSESERSKLTIETKGGKQEVNAVSTTGMLLIISRSNKPEARKLMESLIRVDIPKLQVNTYKNNLVDNCKSPVARGVMISVTGDQRYIEAEPEYIAHSEKYNNWKRAK